MSAKPCAPAAERNCGPILDVIREVFANAPCVLEIGSGTGQHAVHFGRELPHLSWQTSDRFGIVRSCELAALGDFPVEVDLLDGFVNVLPAGAGTDVQNRLSTLLDAYKRTELDPETGLGIMTLSSTLTDLAEPSESPVEEQDLAEGAQTDVRGFQVAVPDALGAEVSPLDAARQAGAELVDRGHGVLVEDRSGAARRLEAPLQVVVGGGPAQGAERHLHRRVAPRILGVGHGLPDPGGAGPGPARTHPGSAPR